ncbi:MAG: hypothetical protein ACIALR_05385, partial [Blastopirellula sp. JB062]
VNYGVSGAGTSHNLVMTGNDISHSVFNAATDGLNVTVDSGLTLNANIQENELDATFFGSGASISAFNNSTINLRMRNNVSPSDFALTTTGGATNLYFEVFGGQAVPNPLAPIDVTGQNTIGAATVDNFIGGTSTRVAPNSLPIPE